MRTMSKTEQKKFIAEKQVKRKKAQKELKQLSAERDTWIKKNTKKDRSSMDGKMMGAVKEQAAGMGVTW